MPVPPFDREILKPRQPAPVTPAMVKCGSPDPDRPDRAVAHAVQFGRGGGECTAPPAPWLSGQSRPSRSHPPRKFSTAPTFKTKGVADEAQEPVPRHAHDQDPPR